MAPVHKAHQCHLVCALPAHSLVLAEVGLLPPLANCLSCCARFQDWPFLCCRGDALPRFSLQVAAGMQGLSAQPELVPVVLQK